jgi:hypothetical protein
MLIFKFEVTKSVGPSVLSKSLVTMPASDDEITVAPLHEGTRKPNLTSQQRRDFVQALLLMVVPGDVELKLMLGTRKSVSETFHVD